MKSRFFLFALGCFVLTACQSTVMNVQTIQQANMRIDTATQQGDQAMETFILPYKTQLDSQMNSGVGTLAHTFELQQPESPLGNWVADIVQAEAQIQSTKPVDFSLFNYRGLRIPSLAQGTLTTRQIFELMPFDNTLVVVELEGKKLQQLFDHVAAKGGWPVSKEVQCTIQQQKAVHIRIQGQAIQPDKIYRIATNDYLANGGDNCVFFKGQPQDNSGRFIRDVVIEYCQKQTSAMSAQVEGRLKIR